jgi:putative nucleotidyltransferase with HDIG domain
MINPPLFSAFIVLVALASALKVILPGFESTVSVNFVFFLLSIASLSLSETLVLGFTAAIVQCYWKKSSHLRFIHFLFNLSQVSAALTASHYVYRSINPAMQLGRMPLALLAACGVYFIFNTAPVAAVVSLTEKKPFLRKYRESYAWASMAYLVGAAIAGIIVMIDLRLGWEITVLVLPAIYALYRTYAIHLGKLESQGRHLQEMADLHLRTVEALALAIEAKDHTTGDHLQRVQVYAIEIGKDLGLNTEELDALRAASVLHDIGKLAVPEYIIGKPGKLTPEEFERMKVHPIVGAEILEQVRFPYSVAPIVRSHHEKWDGSGYPDGLKGEAIPIGARILAVVDCLDALASDRQYRRALPLDEAMQCVIKESGRAFDPKVVAALHARYIELESIVKQQATPSRPKLSVNVHVGRGGAPAAGYAESRKEPAVSPAPAAKLPVSSAPAEDLALICIRLREFVRYDAIAVFARSGATLRTEFAVGMQMAELQQLVIERGEGLVGWIAETGEAILNGNPLVDAGFPHRNLGLCCALGAPLTQAGVIVGVIALYSSDQNAFTPAELKATLEVVPQIAAALNSRPGHLVRHDAPTQERYFVKATV